MTPAEVIAMPGCSRIEDGHPCPICVGAAERHVKAVEAAALVVVSAEDLYRVAVDPLGDRAGFIAARDRLRATLTERTKNV